MLRSVRSLISTIGFLPGNSCFDTQAPLACTLDGEELTEAFDPTSFPPLEYVELIIETDHPRAGDLEVILESPKLSSSLTFGTISLMADVHNSNQNYDGGDDAWVFTSARHWGELPLEKFDGNWKVKIRDKVTGATGTLKSFQLRFYGADVNPTAVDDSFSGLSSLSRTFDVLKKRSRGY